MTETKVRQFKIFNARGDMIDILDNLDFFGYAPEGLGVSFDNEYASNKSNFLLTKNKLTMSQITIQIVFGYVSNKPYDAYAEFIKLLNYPPYTFVYETSAGVWERKAVLNELTKSEMNTLGIMIESFVLDCLSPWRKAIHERSNVIETQKGDGKIYREIDQVPVMDPTYTSPPVNGSVKGELWRWTSNQVWKGKNILNKIDSRNGYWQDAIFTSTAEYRTSWDIKASDIYINLSPLAKSSIGRFTVRIAYFDKDRVFIGPRVLITPTSDTVLPIGVPVYQSASYMQISIETDLYSEVSISREPAVYDRAFEDIFNPNTALLLSTEDASSIHSSKLAVSSDYDTGATMETMYPKDYDYSYSLAHMQYTTKFSYKYDYVYESVLNESNGYFHIENESVYMQNDVQSPIEITVYGPSLNPYWTLVQDSKVIQNDGFKLEVPDGYKLVVSSIPGEQKAVLVDREGHEANVYQQQDLTKTNFISIPTGVYTLIFQNCKAVEYTYYEERVVV